MNAASQSQKITLISYIGLAVFFGLALWLIVIIPMGPGLSKIPGDIGDARFNNFILEHFYQWLIGKEASFWDAMIFFPFPKAIAFSDNFIGSGWFYAIFRLTGSDRETAFQGWFILGFCLNYLSAAYVLLKLDFKPLAAAAGAFYFSFGIPMLLREEHAQLVYRFPVPLACLMLWCFFQNPRFRSLLSFGFWLVWQFYLSIYLGVFLSILLAVAALLMVLSLNDCAFWQRVTTWPWRVKLAWLAACVRERAATIVILACMLVALYLLFQPYLWVSKAYGFAKSPEEVATLLPRWQSYFIADRVSWWQPVSSHFTDIPMRQEQQLFPGVIVFIAIIWSIYFGFKGKNQTIVLLHFFAMLMIVILTLNLYGVTLYQFVLLLPGITSIRAVSRVELVLMWPFALIIASLVEQILHDTKGSVLRSLIMICTVFALLLVDPLALDHVTFSKQEAQQRITRLQNHLPEAMPSDPILFVAKRPEDPWFAAEIDGMILAQQNNWPTLNGYSGNLPNGYISDDRCKALPERILSYMRFTQASDMDVFNHLIQRVVTIDMEGCGPGWRDADRFNFSEITH